jgi:hypothetical protein
MRLSDIAKRMTTVIGVSLLLLISASAAYYRSFAFFPFALGALLGASLNVLKIMSLDRTVEKAMHMEKTAAENHVRFQHFLRFFLTGAILLLSALLPIINIWGTAAGICTLQIATFFSKHPSNKENAAKDTTDS